MISFTVPKKEIPLLKTVIDRAWMLYAATSECQEDQVNLSMDITACYANGCPLDLGKLLAFDDFNFAHDIFGIRRHLDRNTGKLNGFFSPRCAKPETKNKNLKNQ